MPRRRHQAGHRAGPRKMARGEYRIRQELAQYHPEEGFACRRQGFRGYGRQVREIFFSRTGYRRLIESRFFPIGEYGAVSAQSAIDLTLTPGISAKPPLQRPG